MRATRCGGGQWYFLAALGVLLLVPAAFLLWAVWFVVRQVYYRKVIAFERFDRQSRVEAATGLRAALRRRRGQSCCAWLGALSVAWADFTQAATSPTPPHLPYLPLHLPASPHISPHLPTSPPTPPPHLPYSPPHLPTSPHLPRYLPTTSPRPRGRSASGRATRASSACTARSSATTTTPTPPTSASSSQGSPASPYIGLALYLPNISPTSPPYLPCISARKLGLPHTSPPPPPYMPHTSPTSPLPRKLGSALFPRSAPLVGRPATLRWRLLAPG